MSALTLSQILADLAAVSVVVAGVITQLVAPLLARIPALSPSAADQTLRNWALRLANLLLSVVGVLVMAAASGQLVSWSNVVPTAAAVLAAAFGAHAAYKVIPSSASVPASSPAPAPTSAQIAAAGMIAQPPAAI